MNFHVLTLFPDMIMNGLKTSITGRAIEKGLINVEAIDIRDYTTNKHNKVDDYPYGGGAGMLMQAEPVCRAYEAVVSGIKAAGGTGAAGGAGTAGGAVVAGDTVAAEGAGAAGGECKKPRVVYVTPQGYTFNQKWASDFAKEDDLIILCGHYEGIDERALESIVTDFISIGDYVLTGGELPAMVMIDCVSRLVPGVLNNDVSAEFESFHDDLLEYPQYTRPEVFEGKAVPEVLLSGHHGNIEKWRHEKAIERTKKFRPDLYEKYCAAHKDDKNK